MLCRNFTEKGKVKKEQKNSFGWVGAAGMGVENWIWGGVDDGYSY